VAGSVSAVHPATTIGGEYGCLWPFRWDAANQDIVLSSVKPTVVVEEFSENPH
jgi:hypothetical protein